MFKKHVNCCDGIYNSLDVHFTSACDNKCKHCVDMRFSGLNVTRPDVSSICKTILENYIGVDDVLFLGGEPLLYIDELLECVKFIKNLTPMKVYVTTSVPKTCFDNYDKFLQLLELIDGLNISVQHHLEPVANEIRQKFDNLYDRQTFYNNLPYKEKIRVNLNIVKPFLYTRIDIRNCLVHYDSMGFNSIKISEIQHGTEHFVSFKEIFGIKLPNPYSHGCQIYLENLPDLLNCPKFKTPVLLKASCFLCEDTLKASIGDGFKVLSKLVMPAKKNKYGVIYGNGSLQKGWI